MRAVGLTGYRLEQLLDSSRDSGGCSIPGIGASPQPPTLSAQEVARFLGVEGTESVLRRVQSGELPAVRYGCELRFHLSDVENYARVLRSTGVWSSVAFRLQDS
jgi:excisionase family DNA binding protein